MDDLEFRQRALANPRDLGEEFLAAAGQSPERRRFLDELLDFENSLGDLLRFDSPPGLKARLLDPAALESGASRSASPARRLLARLLPVAACLAVAAGAVLDVWQPETDPAFEREIFVHVYRELAYLGMDNDVTLDAVNRYMAAVEGRLRPGDDLDSLELKVADDCWVNGSDTVHLVIGGERGAVTVLLVRGTPVEREFPINDRRFTGLVTPARGGNLVVLGERQERLSRYKRTIASSLDWEY